jgi:hypothetical protein
MAAIIRDTFKTNAIQQFINSLSSNSLYLGIGRPQYWDTTSGTDTTDYIVTDPITNIQTHKSRLLPDNTFSSVESDWEDMMSLKRLTSADAIAGMFKELWQANTVYDCYRHDWNGTRPAVYSGINATALPASLADVKCFVITSSYNTYACLKQGIVNGVVQPSIYSPDTGVSVGTTQMIKTADNYVWKYISTTSSEDVIKFSSTYYHPVETVLSAPASTVHPYYEQWLAQQASAAYKGGIYIINVLNGGSGYNGSLAGSHAVTNAKTDTQFKILGNGSGLQFTVAYGSGGIISSVDITNPGRGYSYATITAIGGSGAAFDIIFTPMYGLGCDPVRDCACRYVILNTTLAGAEGGDFTIANDYRKITLVMNPFNIGSTTVATSTTLDSTIHLNVGTPQVSGAYPSDAIVTGSTTGAKARVVDFNATTGLVRCIRTSTENQNIQGSNNDFSTLDTLTSSPGSGNTAIMSLASPEVVQYSGDIIYSEYRGLITRTGGNESLTITVKF